MNTSMRITLPVICTTCLLMLTGCGGGGDSTPAVSSGAAEGVYGGNLTGSTSKNFQMLVLENDEIWSMYGTQTSSQFLVTGFVQGNGTSSNGSFTSSNVRDFGYAPALSGTASATYSVVAKTMSGGLSAGGGTVSFNGGPIAGSLYDYNAPASLSAVTGNWSLTALTGESVSVAIASSGLFSATTSLGCKFSGSLTPRPSGKNVFNLSLTFGASPCALPGQTASGISLAYPLATGQTQLIMAGANSTRTIGTAAFGTR